MRSKNYIHIYTYGPFPQVRLSRSPAAWALLTGLAGDLWVDMLLCFPSLGLGGSKSGGLGVDFKLCGLELALDLSFLGHFNTTRPSFVPGHG